MMVANNRKGKEVVETIQKANNAANSVWTTAPEEWLSTYSPTVNTAG